MNRTVKSRAAYAIVVIALLAVMTSAAFAWPKYGAQTLKTQRGLLTSFSNGNMAGGLSIRLSDGTVRDFATLPGTTWNHHRISCSMPPTKQTPCADWPKTIVPLKSSVTVTYWDDVRRGPGVPGPIRVAKDVSSS